MGKDPTPYTWHGLVRQVGEVLSPILAAATTRRAQLLQMKETSTGHG